MYTPQWILEKRSNVGPYWETYSQKAGRVVRLYGDLVYYLWILLESTPEWTELTEQPFVVRRRAPDGSRVKALPAFWARARNGNECLFNVRYSRLPKTQDGEKQLQQQLWAVQDEARARGWAYELKTDKMLLEYPTEVANWSLILRYVAAGPDDTVDDLQHRIAGFLRTVESASIRCTQREFEGVAPDRVEKAIFLSMHRGTVVGDLRDQPLTGRTILRYAAPH